MKDHGVVVSQHGGPDVLQVTEEVLPKPAAGEARVRVQAAGVSAYDLMHRRSGRLPGTPKAPMFPTLDKLAESEPECCRGTLTELLDAVAGKIRPLVAEQLPLAEAGRAHESLERGGQHGKVVLVAGQAA
jgi:NADPH:quinone reductase-like Zn-dependent oxidoreductase